MSQICVRAENLSKRFFLVRRKQKAMSLLISLMRREPLNQELWVLREASFDILKGERIALIGKNGAGKTTLIRIICGILNQTQGELEVDAMPNVLFKTMTGCYGDLRVIDNINLLGAVYRVDPGWLRENTGKILEVSGLEQLKYVPMKNLSSGQVQRLVLSVFLKNSNDFLIFDECLSAVDRDFMMKFEKEFREFCTLSKTVLMTSHDGNFLRRHCDTAIWLDEGKVRMHDKVDKVIDEYERFA